MSALKGAIAHIIGELDIQHLAVSQDGNEDMKRRFAITMLPQSTYSGLLNLAT